jgi:Ca2+-binding EF-hand superfamily protein
MRGNEKGTRDKLPPVTPRAEKSYGSSAGQRAAERFLQKSAEKAAIVRAERAERLSTHLMKGEGGSSPRVASAAEQEQVSTLLNQRMADVFQDPQARSWYKLFIHMDDDGSGKINFHELEDMIRNELRVPFSMLSEEQLKAVWRCLDEDQSGLITTGEFGRFMRVGAHIHEKDASWKMRAFDAKQSQGSSTRKEMKELLERARDSSRSAEESAAQRAARIRQAEVGRSAAAVAQVHQRNAMSARTIRQERDERLSRHLMKGNGGAPKVASEQECEQVATILNQRMAEIILDPQARSWYKLFVHMDDDCSGKINYHELEDMIRNELKVGRDRLSEEQLKAIWHALDEDKSGLITAGEFGKFMRKGAHVHEVSEPGREKELRGKKALGDLTRQEKEQRRMMISGTRSTEEASKKTQAAHVHDAAWGLRALAADEQKPLWHSSRALIF